MSNKEIVKKYSNGDFNVIWKPKICIHAAECVKRLPNVYDPQKKPWIKAENASIDELKIQIDACPSGALSYETEGVINKDAVYSVTKINILKDGPLLVNGNISIENHNGEIEIKNTTTALCRCGASTNKPYCDGAHHKIEFKG